MSKSVQYNAYKIVIIGDVHTGKTSLIKRYCLDKFTDGYKSTIGVDFLLKTVKYANDETYMIQLWDIAGQERFGQLTRIYYRDAKGAVVVFDITHPEGLEAAKKWKRDFDNKLELTDERTPPVLLVANKSDLVGALSPEFKRDLDKFCADNNFIGWSTTSALTSSGVEEAFNRVISKMIELFPPIFKTKDNGTNIELGNTDTQPPSGRICC